MRSMGRIRAAGALWVASGMIASLAALLYFWPQRDELRATYWQQQLAAAPDERVDECLQQLVNLGDAGIGALIESISSARPQISSQARLLLLREIDSWETLSASHATPKLVRLADELTERIDR